MGSIAQFLSAYIFATKARIDNRKKPFTLFLGQCHLTRSKVKIKVTELLNFRKLHFS